MQKKRDPSKYQQCAFVWEKDFWARIKDRAMTEHMTAASYVRYVLEQSEKELVKEETESNYEQLKNRIELLNDQMKQLDIKMNSIMAMTSTALNKILDSHEGRV